MRTAFALPAILLSLCLLAPASAMAEGVPGEVWVTLVGTDYAKPYLENSEHEDHEFEDDGKKLVIRMGDISIPHSFEVRPHDDSLQIFEVTTDEKAFKATRIKGQKARRMVMKVTAKFPKKPADKPPEEPKPADEPAPAPEK